MENNNLIPVHTTFENAINYDFVNLTYSSLPFWKFLLTFFRIKKYIPKVTGSVMIYEKISTIIIHDTVRTNLNVYFICTEIHDGLKKLTLTNEVNRSDIFNSKELYLHSRGMPGETYLLGNI